MQLAIYRLSDTQAKLDWLAAITTLGVSAALELEGGSSEAAASRAGESDDEALDESAAIGYSRVAAAQRRRIVRQGYLWTKLGRAPAEPAASSGDAVLEKSKEKLGSLAAKAALELATRLEPWRRRWFVLSVAPRPELVWYTAPPADDSEVPSGCAAARAQHATRAKIFRGVV